MIISRGIYALFLVLALALLCGGFNREVCASEEQPALFYIELHTELVIRSKADFDLETELLKRLAAILERHNAKGSFMLLDIYPKAMKLYGRGSVNEIAELETRGHEIGVHYHAGGPESTTIASTISDVKSSGARRVESLTASFLRTGAAIVLSSPDSSSDKMERMVEEAYRGGMTSAFRWCMADSVPVRVNRNAWITTDRNACWNEAPVADPLGAMVGVGMYEDAGYTFSEHDDSFKELLVRMNRAVSKWQRGKINYYPVAIHDYYFLNPSGTQTVNRIVAINEERLKAFDGFLTAVDRSVAKGVFRYSTRSGVTRAFIDSEKGQPQPAAATGGNLNVFYTIHVHSGANDRPEFVPLNRDDYEGTAKALDAIAKTLEAHGAVASFQVMQNFAEAAVRYESAGRNILNELEKRGHEIDAHVHTDRFNQWQKTRDAILAAGVRKVYAISGTKLTKLPGADAFARVAELDYTVVTGNNSPVDPMPMEGFAGASFWGFEGNRQYESAGAFVYPWFPDYEGKSLVRHNPQGKVLYLDTVPPILWMSGGGGQLDFDKLKRYFTAALASAPSSVRGWGFITHEMDYQSRGGVFRPTNEVSAEAIKGLDDFLTFLDAYRDSIKWETPYSLFREMKNDQAVRYH